MADDLAGEVRQQCACPMQDGRECYRWRHKVDMREHLGEEVYLSDDDECCCRCHVEYELSLQDEEWADG